MSWVNSRLTFRVASIGLLAYVLLLCITLTVKAKNTPFWLDEAYTVFVARRPFTSLVEEIKRDVHPPLYYALTALWIRVFGDTELSVRSLSLVLFIISIALVYCLSNSIKGNPEDGLYTAWFFALSYVCIAHATNARSYMLLCALSILCTYYMIAIVVNNHVGAKVVFSYLFTTLFGLLSHYAFAYVLLAHFLVVLLYFRRSMVLIVSLIGLAFALFLLLWGPIFLIQWKYGMAIGGAWMKKTSVRTLFELLTIPFGPTGTQLGLASVAFYASATLFPLLLKSNQNSSFPSAPSSNALWVTLLVSMTLIPLVLSCFKPNFVPSRQGIVAIPFFCIVIIQYWRLRLSWKFLLTLLIILSLGRLSMYTWIAVRSYNIVGTDKWIAQQIMEMAKPGDVVILSDLSWCPVGYYLHKLGSSEKFLILPFPSDIPDHPGWRNLAYYDSSTEIQILSQRIRVGLHKGKRNNIVVALGSGQLYRDLQAYLENQYMLLEKRSFPRTVTGKSPTYVYQILKFAPSVEAETRKSDSH